MSYDWEARANREAAAIVMEVGGAAGRDYDQLVRFVAIGWLQGHMAGSQETLADSMAAFDRLRSDLVGVGGGGDTA